MVFKTFILPSEPESKPISQIFKLFFSILLVIFRQIKFSLSKTILEFGQLEVLMKSCLQFVDFVQDKEHHFLGSNVRVLNKFK